ncbi:unnamed protein product, partial [Allacma fusca]
IIPLKGWTNP